MGYIQIACCSRRDSSAATTTASAAVVYSALPTRSLNLPPCDRSNRQVHQEADPSRKMKLRRDFTPEGALVAGAVDDPHSLVLPLNSSSSSSGHNSYKWAGRPVHLLNNNNKDFLLDKEEEQEAAAAAEAPIIRRSKAVRFSNVHVREYALTVGDHPRCKGECPMSLSWEYNQHAPSNIERYEQERLRRSCSRRITSKGSKSSKKDNTGSSNRRRSSSFNLNANQRRRRLVSVLGSWDALCRLEMEAARASLQEELEQLFEFENDDDDDNDDEGEDCFCTDYEDDYSESESYLFSLVEEVFPGLDAESLACCMEEDETLRHMILNILASRGSGKNIIPSSSALVGCSATMPQAGVSLLAPLQQ